MNKTNSKKFINFLDSYNKNIELNSFDYSILISGINTHFNENRLFDTSFVGNVKIPKSDTETHYYFKSFDSSYGGFYDYSYNLGFHLTNNSPKNEYNFDNNNIYSLWQSQYLQWQKDHEANLLNIPTDKPDENRTFLQIDASITCLNDIITIIDNNEYKSNIDCNIDLKSLHNIKAELTQLNKMVGMESMKQSILDQLLYFIQELHLSKDSSDFKHTVIYGPPGTGKTEIAKIIGRMYSKMGILKNNIFKKVTRNDLIAGYLGQTAIKTKKVIDECIGGVLFIDEAYSLASGGVDNNDIYSKECIDILCEALSDYKSNLMVIIAGYEDELNETFFRVNRGLNSRFIWRFTMESYNPIELKQIFKKMIADSDWSIEHDEIIKNKWFDDRKEHFTSFGRDMEALLTYTKIAHGRRIYGKDKDLRKKISLVDINEGYDIFLKNKKIKKTEPNILYGLYV
jgi:hypothetical protein